MRNDDLNPAKLTVSILFVIDGLEYGGGERTFLQLIGGLPHNRYDVHVATSPHGELCEKLSSLGMNAIPLDLGKRLDFRNIWRLRRIIKDNAIDIVHSQGARSDFYVRMAGRTLKPGVKVVNTIAVPVESYDVNAMRRKVYMFFDRLSRRYVDRFIVVSQVLEDTLVKKYRIEHDIVTRVYNGIELGEYCPDDVSETAADIRDEFDIGGEAPLIGAVGRMVWPKGFEYLIRSIPEIAEQYPAVKVILVGTGALKQDLEDLTEELGLGDRIIFTGFRTDIKEILSAVDVLVISSLQEGFPIITLEAMAMAKPIVATRIDGITEQMTDGVEGILVPSRDPSALAAAVVSHLNNRERAHSMGLSARKSVEDNFSVEHMITETEKVYMSLWKDH